jgi:small subunit ribosomal protein S20
VAQAAREVFPLAHSKSALKRWRQNEAHRERNKGVRTASRTAVKKARTAIVGGASDEAQAAIREAAAVLDRAAKKHVIHPNAASRHKSRMMRQLNKASGPVSAEAAAPKKMRKPAAKTPTAKAKAPAKAKTPAKAKAKAPAKAPAKPRATRAKPAAKS